MIFDGEVNKLRSILWLVAGCWAAPLMGQSEPPVVASPVLEASGGADADDVERALAELEASDLESGIKQPIKARFDEVSKRLAGAEKSRAAAEFFRTAVTSAPDEIAALRSQIEALPSKEEVEKIDEKWEVEELREANDAARAELADLINRLATAESELGLMRARPVEVAARLPQARIELAEAVAALQGVVAGADESPARKADRMLAEANRQALQAEVEALTQEQLSQAVRERRRLARRDLLQAQLELGRASSAALGQRLNQAVASAADRLSQRIEALADDVDAGDEQAQARLVELRELSAALQASTRRLEEVDLEQAALEREKEALAGQFQRTREQVNLGAADGSFAQILLEERRRLPDPKSFSKSIDARENEVRKEMLAAFGVDGKLREQDELEEAAEGDPQRGSLLEIRAELLEKLRKNHGQLVRDLSQLDTDQRAYRDLIIEVRDYLADKLFWRKSSPPIGAEFFGSLPQALEWTFGVTQWRDCARAIASIPGRHPVATPLFGVILAALLLLRGKIIRSLENSGRRIRKISTDRFVHTLRALLDSVLLALPLPLAFSFLGWGISTSAVDSNWVRGFAQGLSWCGVYLIGGLVLREICRTGGLGEAHFGWEVRATGLLRRAILWLLCLYTPFVLVVSMTLHEESSRHFDSAGRLGFILTQVWIAVVFARLFHPDKGVFAGIIAENPGRLVSRTRHLWYAALVGAPLVLVVLAGIGYLWTALALSFEFQSTLRIIMIGVLVYGLLERWMMIKQRRIALNEAIAARKDRRREAEEGVEKGADEGLVVEVEDEELDMRDVIRQTHRLLRSVVGIGVVMGVWLLWSKTLPLDHLASSRTVGGGLSFLGVVEVLILIPITLSLVRNLPGLLDVVGLRSSGMDAGARYAVTTICQYLLIAVALALVFKILNLDWSRFGWIAAALSVGLGFGLQEVVANFVCGIILLFERPIRIGDVVTLSQVTGTVSRIRMRATTITNWDSQDFVVPNKEFITGSLINWTLSSKINRIVLPVGVAYGTDTRRARQVMAEVAKAHPEVMAEPEPRASFEAFADSTLNLVLRCFLPNMDNRLSTITDLHEEIDRRFKEEGIEIAFPQRDLHLRTAISQAVPLAGGSGENPA